MGTRKLTVPSFGNTAVQPKPGADYAPPRAGWGRGAASAWRMLQRQELNRQLFAPRG